MTVEELEIFLYQLTDSEKIHRSTTSNKLSDRYNRISKTKFNNKEMYLFKFDSLFHDRNVCVNKESRFTFIPEHIHTVIEFLYVYSGTCTQIIDGKTIEMHQGDICMLDTNIPHSINYINENDILISIEIRKEYLTQGFLSRLGDKGIINSFLINALSLNTEHDQYLLFKNSNIHHIVQQILCEYYDSQVCSNQIMDAYMIVLFCELLRQYKDLKYNNKAQDSMIIQILNYIEYNYLTTTLKDTAAHFGFHPNYLSSFIKSNTGKSFKELIIFQRMSQACFYLSNTDIPIYDIAHNIGYDNLGFFYKKFETIYKITPQQYRDLKNKVTF